MTTQIGLETTVTACEEIVFAELGEETTLLSLRNGVYYGLDEVGTTVWGMIQRPVQVKAIHAALLREYEVDPESCAAGLVNLLQELAGEELIRAEEAPPA